MTDRQAYKTYLTERPSPSTLRGGGGRCALGSGRGFGGGAISLLHTRDYVSQSVSHSYNVGMQVFVYRTRIIKYKLVVFNEMSWYLMLTYALMISPTPFICIDGLTHTLYTHR